MAKKVIAKTKVDKQQSKDIRMLKRALPTQREVVEVNDSTIALSTAPVITRLSPVTLDNQKLLINGFDMRLTLNVDPTSTDGIFYRYLIVMYKCDVSHSAGTPSVTEPTAGDIIDNRLNQTVGMVNPNNSSRIRILYDSTVNLQPPIGSFQGMRTYRRFFKKPINHLATNDKAFVHRPFLLKFGSNSAATGIVDNVAINVHTTQLP